MRGVPQGEDIRTIRVSARDGHVVCSFCKGGSDGVRQLLAGLDDVFICSECIAFCVGFLDEQKEE